MEHKDVSIEGKTYRIGRFTAKVGSSIVTQLLPKLLPFMEGERLDLPTVIKMLPTISESELGSIQDHCISVCSRYEDNGAVMPVFVRGGIWAVKELEFDTPAVMALTCHTLMFNLAPFFTGGGLRMILQSVLGSSQQAS